jgi:hypothetical protein
MARRPLALVLLFALFACVVVPAAAFAQSAGDDQYQDPLGPNGGGSKNPTPAPTPPKSQGATHTAAPSAAAAQPTSANKPARDVPLARTGFDAWVPAVVGALLLAGGAALLLVPRRQARRR